MSLYFVTQRVPKKLWEAPAMDAVMSELLEMQSQRPAAAEPADAPAPNVKKLSALQWDILDLAYQWQRKTSGSIWASDVKAEIFGWTAKYIMSEIDAETKTRVWYDMTYLLEPGTARLTADNYNFPNGHVGGHIFDHEGIDPKKRNSVCASISRAFLRLVDRGLMTRGLHGLYWSLTKGGAETVKRKDWIIY